MTIPDEANFRPFTYERERLGDLGIEVSVPSPKFNLRDTALGFVVPGKLRLYVSRRVSEVLFNFGGL